MMPDEFFSEFVLKDYEDWKKELLSFRKAFHSAVSAFHMADHYFCYYSRHTPQFATKYENLQKFQKALTGRTPSFKTIQDMANAYKHLYTRDSSSVDSSGSITIFYRNKTIEEDWSEENGQQIAGIVIRRKKMPAVQFSIAIENVVAMWEAIMKEGDQPVLSVGS